MTVSKLTGHTAIPLVVGDRCADVDEGIAKIVAGCMLANIDTVESCEDWEADLDFSERRYSEPMMFLSFHSGTDMARFGNILLRFGPKDDLYGRIIGGMPDSYTGTRWEWASTPDDASPLWDDPEAPVEPGWMHSVVFPASDHRAVEGRLEAFFAAMMERRS